MNRIPAEAITAAGTKYHFVSTSTLFVFLFVTPATITIEYRKKLITAPKSVIKFVAAMNEPVPCAIPSTAASSPLSTKNQINVTPINRYVEYCGFCSLLYLSSVPFLSEMMSSEEIEDIVLDALMKFPLSPVVIEMITKDCISGASHLAVSAPNTFVIAPVRVRSVAGADTKIIIEYMM